MTPTVRLAPDERRFLAGHLRRLTGWDPRCAVRLLTRGDSLAVLGTTPMDALSFFAVPTAGGAGVDALDRCVAAAGLLAALERVARPRGAGSEGSGPGGAGPEAAGLNGAGLQGAGPQGAGPEGADGIVDVPLPEEHVPVADLAVLPPKGPWIPAQRATAGDVSPLVVAALDRFRAETEAGAEPAEDVAERLWDERTWGGLPLRALHAARALGFLSRDAGRVEAATCAGWKRFRTPAGQVFVRPVGAAARLTLSVLS